MASCLFSLSNAQWKNTSKESEDHEKNPQWKTHAEQFPEGACLQTIPDFFSWLKSNYSPAGKHQGCEYFGRMVLQSAPWCSSLALRLVWRCQVGWWGWVSCRRQGHWKTGTPNQRRRQSHPQLLVFVTGPGNYQVAGKYPFLCQRCVISLRSTVPSELCEPFSYRWRVNHHWSKGRTNCKAIVNSEAEEFSFHRCKYNSSKKLLKLYSVYGCKNHHGYCF